jgi:hypothetical protein
MRNRAVVAHDGPGSSSLKKRRTFRQKAANLRLEFAVGDARLLSRAGEELIADLGEQPTTPAFNVVPPAGASGSLLEFVWSYSIHARGGRNAKQAIIRQFTDEIGNTARMTPAIVLAIRVLRCPGCHSINQHSRRHGHEYADLAR